jgi:hypothetical protein
MEHPCLSAHKCQLIQNDAFETSPRDQRVSMADICILRHAESQYLEAAQVVLETTSRHHYVRPVKKFGWMRKMGR